jgi:hypothetical protein
MRHAARIDRNQVQITQALRAAGATVYPTHMVGAGFTDLVVGLRGRTFLLEVKSGAGALTEAEQDFAAGWRGHVAVVRSPEDALAVLGLA